MMGMMNDGRGQRNWPLFPTNEWRHPCGAVRSLENYEVGDESMCRFESCCLRLNYSICLDCFIYPIYREIKNHDKMRLWLW